MSESWFNVDNECDDFFAQPFVVDMLSLPSLTSDQYMEMYRDGKIAYLFSILV